MKSAGVYCEDEHRTNIRGRATAAAPQVEKLLLLALLQKNQTSMPTLTQFVSASCIYVISHPCTQQS